MKKYILSILSIVWVLNLNAQCEDKGNYWKDSWVSCATAPSPNPLRGDMTYWLLYDFEQAQIFDTTYFWNANRTGESGWGAKEVAIDYSIDGSNWVELGVFEFAQAPETDNYEGFLGPEFDNVFVEKILITILSTHDGGDCASIAEVQFQIDKSACYGVLDDCGICDGPGAITWYQDADTDGLGDPNNSVVDCVQPSGYVENNGDLCDNGALGWAEVASLFTDNGCNSCHGADAAGGLDLRSFIAASAGGTICGTDIFTETKLVDIINISNFDGCGTAISFPSMNARAGNQMDAEELAQLQMWIDGGAPELCSDFCLDFLIDEAVSICSGENYTFPDGLIQNNIQEDIVYTSNLISSGGCDSLITTELLVTVVDTSVSALSANAISATYQWLDCENNFEVISGATNQSFNALENGNYAVAITQDGCVDTSGCHSVLLVGIDEVEETLYGLKPNPVEETLYLTGEFHQTPRVTIYNASGQVCLVPFNANDRSLNVNGLAEGIYLLILQVEDKSHVLEFVKQR